MANKASLTKKETLERLEKIIAALQVVKETHKDFLDIIICPCQKKHNAILCCECPNFAECEDRQISNKLWQAYDEPMRKAIDRKTTLEKAKRPTPSKPQPKQKKPASGKGI